MGELKLSGNMRIIPLDTEGKASELEPAYVELCRQNEVDPVGLHVDLQDCLDQGVAGNGDYVSHIFSAGEVRVILACIEVAGGF